MASSNVAPALMVLTGNQFTPSYSPNNSRLEALVTEYFTTNDENADHENSDYSEGITKMHWLFAINFNLLWVGESDSVTEAPFSDNEQNDEVSV